MSTVSEKPTLTESKIVDAANRYRESTGQPPTKYSGDATLYYGAGVTWSSIDQALRDGKQGLPGGSSLKELLSKS